MSSLPKISIVTPSFNQGKYLETTITSILSQNYPNLEYVIIDGGSQDESIKVIKKYRRFLKYWVSEPDKGQADAINKGFRHTSGEIMTWLNSDDMLLPGTLHLIAKLFSSLPQVSWVTGIPTTINKDGFLMHVGLKPVYFRSLINHGYYHGRALGFIMQEGTFWRRKLWKKAGGKLVNSYYSMDYQLWRKFAQYEDLIPISTSLAAFRLNPQRKTRAIDKYYQEIGVHLSELSRFLFLPIRFLISYGFRKTGLSNEVYYDQLQSLWQFRPSLIKRFKGAQKTSISF